MIPLRNYLIPKRGNKELCIFTQISTLMPEVDYLENKISETFKDRLAGIG